MRRAYETAGLDVADLAPTWHEQAERWIADAVEGGIGEPNAMTLATASADGVPSARTVLLKGLDARGLVWFTNLRSRKGREAAENPRAAITIAWVPLARQVLATGIVEPVSDEDSDAYFASRPRGSQLGAVASPQSEVVASRAQLDELLAAAAARFPEGTPVQRPAHWGGLRLVPDAVEVWQGRPDRMHDRLRFRLTGEGWTVERLAP
ncbi:pyridoxamine 5'-phosphate oxidase [Conexibacter sp. SYSU D00693]|uniref:pyridoxamine 5'-phosphate oxidase n=1 Tax=Conexibacter sp. SYSU D00693 TaxID=2812560 RepID=UPI00196A4479|nr:pyridoxamine 5'-phosphate oxidase [Conexibacter sp. SYSU D00693]